MIKSKRKIHLNLPGHINGPTLRHLFKLESAGSALNTTITSNSNPGQYLPHPPGTATTTGTAVQEIYPCMPPEPEAPLEGSIELHEALEAPDMDLRVAMRVILRKMVGAPDSYGHLYTTLMEEYNTVVKEFARASTAPSTSSRQANGSKNGESMTNTIQGGGRTRGVRGRRGQGQTVPFTQSIQKQQRDDEYRKILPPPNYEDIVPVPVVKTRTFCHATEDVELREKLTEVTGEIENMELENKVLRVQLQESMFENQKLQSQLATATARQDSSSHMNSPTGQRSLILKPSAQLLPTLTKSLSSTKQFQQSQT